MVSDLGNGQSSHGDCGDSGTSWEWEPQPYERQGACE